MKKTLAITVLLLTAMTVFAQTPQKFNYQAIQEQQDQIEALKIENSVLKNQNDELVTRLIRLEKIVEALVKKD
ncbi:MAG: hypothetical protein ACKVT2_16915 [Saprospiraceae bacterium]